MRELRIVWALVAALIAATVATYWRLPVRELYDVSSNGVGGGLGRAVVELNYPAALVGLGVLGVAFPYLAPRLRWLAALAAVLCLVVVVPGVVRQSDLDARWINAVPAAGVALAVALSLLSPTPSGRAARGDRLRIVVGVVLVFAASPWIGASLGYFLDRVPLLGSVFETGKLVTYHGNAMHHAVHHGLHHGLDGLVLALSALLLSRVPNRVPLLLALLLAYGVADIANDDWLEQIAERGWTSWTVPASIEPSVNLTWLGVVVGTLVVWALWFRQPSTTTSDAASARTPASS